jgi:Putative esterase
MAPGLLHRTRDYTPTNVREMAGGGGAAAYLAFLKTELIPLIERRYRADSAQRGLGGHSLGGLFATYALAHDPGLFRRYWIGSPSLWWDKQVAFTWLPALQQRAAAVTGRAYVTVGALETDVMVPPAQRLARALTTGFPGLRTGSQVFADETHASVVAGALMRALRYLYTAYGQPTVAFAPATHGSFAGTWVTADQRELAIRPRPGGLQLVMSEAGNVLRANLLASARDSLFTRELPIVLAATRDAQGRVQRLRTSMGGVNLEYTRKP